MSDYRPMPEWLAKIAGETKGFEEASYPYPFEKQGKLNPRRGLGSSSPLDGALVYRSLYHAVIWVPGFSYYANSMSGTVSHGMQMKLVRLAFPGEDNFKYSGRTQLSEYKNEGESRPVTKELFLGLVGKCNTLDEGWPTAYERAAAEVLRKEEAERAAAAQVEVENAARARLLAHGPALVEAVGEALDVLDFEDRDMDAGGQSAMLKLLKMYRLIKGDEAPVEPAAVELDPRAENTSP